MPTNFIAAGEAVTVLDLAGDAAAPRFELPRLGQTLALAYQKNFALEVEEKKLAIGATPLPGEFARNPDPAALASRPGVRAAGLLGPVEAWATQDAGRLGDLEIRGDFLAPATLPRELAIALRGCATDAGTIGDRIRDFLDDDEHYLLGLKPEHLADLVLRALGTTA